MSLISEYSGVKYITNSKVAFPTLEAVDISNSTVLADKAYGSFFLREYIADQNTDYCIPPKSNETDPWFIDFYFLSSFSVTPPTVFQVWFRL